MIIADTSGFHFRGYGRRRERRAAMGSLQVLACRLSAALHYPIATCLLLIASTRL